MENQRPYLELGVEFEAGQPWLQVGRKKKKSTTIEPQLPKSITMHIFIQLLLVKHNTKQYNDSFCIPQITHTENSNLSS